MGGGKRFVEVAGLLVGELNEERGTDGVEVFAVNADGAGALAGPACAGFVVERALVDFRAANGGEHGRGGSIDRLFEGNDVAPRVVIAALGAVRQGEPVQPTREVDAKLGGRWR